MASIRFCRGLASYYNVDTKPTTEYKDAIYFATDTKQIFLDGVAYSLSSEQATKLDNAFNSASIVENNKIKFTRGSGTDDVTITLPDATTTFSGLMSAADKTKLNELKDAAGITSEITTAISTAIKDLKGDVEDYDTLGKLEDAVKANEDAIAALGGAGEGSIKKQIDTAISGIKGEVSGDYDTLKKLEDKIKAEVTRATTAEGTKLEESGITATDIWGALEELVKGYKAADTSIQGQVTELKTNVGTKDDESAIVAEDVWGALEEINANTGGDMEGIQSKITEIRNELGSKDSPEEGTIHKDIDDLQTKIATKADLVGGKVPAAQLPGYVDDVVEGTMNEDLTTFTPSDEGEVSQKGKIYVDTTTNKTYRWSGTKYVEVSGATPIGTTEGTAYDGSAGAKLRSDFDSYKSSNDSRVQSIEDEIGEKAEDNEGTATGIYKYIDEKVGGEHEDLTDLTERVTAAEGKLTIIQGEDSVEGSIKKSLKDAKEYADQLLSWEDITE